MVRKKPETQLIMTLILTFHHKSICFKCIFLINVMQIIGDKQYVILFGFPGSD